jgi:SAM-dependent methyltransferase
MEARKSTTDLHWSERARSVAQDVEVNIMDVFQRELEYDYIEPYLDPGMSVLEVGCGNGFSTDRFRKCAKWVDAFDYSEDMVARARSRFGEANNRFFHDDVLDPHDFRGPYDAVVCVRVLINLKDSGEQMRALDNMDQALRSGGRLILAEGFTEGFEQLNRLRAAVGLPALAPAPINYYTPLAELVDALRDRYEVEGRFHLGAYDYLTRVVYPLQVGPENAKHNTNFSERCQQLARAFNPDAFEHLSRIRGLVLTKR